jgi:hypothetical protein
VRQALIEPLPVAAPAATTLGRAAPAVTASAARPLRAMPAQSARQAPRVSGSVAAQASAVPGGSAATPVVVVGGVPAPAAPPPAAVRANPIERAPGVPVVGARSARPAIDAMPGAITPAAPPPASGRDTPREHAPRETPSAPAPLVAEREAASDAGAAPAALVATTVPPTTDPAATDAAGRVALRRWRSRVHAYVGTHHVHVELRTLGSRFDWRPARTLRRRVERGAGATLAAALDALDDALHALRANAEGATEADFGQAACDVVLADAWLVYDVIDIDLATLSPSLAERAVSAALADIAGLPAESLSVRWQRQRGGHGAFGMAIARDDIEALRRLLSRHGLRLAAVTGEFVAVLKSQREALKAEQAIVAIGRAAGTQLAAVIDGEIAAMQFEAGPLGPSGLPGVAQRALRARGLETGASLSYCVDLCPGDFGALRAPAERDSGTGESLPGWRWLPAPAWARPA